MGAQTQVPGWFIGGARELCTASLLGTRMAGPLGLDWPNLANADVNTEEKRQNDGERALHSGMESRPSRAVLAASEDDVYDMCRYDIGSPTAATERTDSVLTKLLGWHERLRARRAQYKEAKETLEAKKASLMAKNGGEKLKGKLKINVGGQRVVTMRDTLTQFKGTKIEALFSGRWESRLLRDKKDRIFLDMNPDCFQKILEYHIRHKNSPDEPLFLPEVPKELRIQFDQMFNFFGLTSTLSVKSVAQQQSNVLEASIDYEKKAEALNTWLEEEGYYPLQVKSQLLYRGTRDGFQAADFHRCCDDKGPTVTLIRTPMSGQSIFGGFADKPWTSGEAWSHTWEPSNKAFLFSLGGSPHKMELGIAMEKLAGHNEQALCHRPNLGPSFGTGGLSIVDCCNTESSSSSILGTTTYRLPAGLPASPIPPSFKVAEIEVFAVEKIDDEDPDQDEDALGSLLKSASSALAAEEHELNCLFEVQKDLEKQFQEEEAFILQLFGPDDTVVDLNICGEPVAVKRSTLRLCPESALACKFDAGSWKQHEDNDDSDSSEDEGELIEENAYCFKTMINQLRLRAMAPEDFPPPPPNIVPHEKEEFSRLLHYHFPGHEAFVFPESPMEEMDSLILDKAQWQQLCDWYGGPKFELLYRGSRDSFKSSAFHELCDKTAKTITVIRTTSGYIFGGCASLSWGETKNSYKRLSGQNGSVPSSLFSLRCHAGLPPLMMKPKSDSHTQLYSSETSWGMTGPTFGAGHDLYIANESNTNMRSYSNVGSGYECPEGQPATFLNGETNFQVAEIEVFRRP